MSLKLLGKNWRDSLHSGKHMQDVRFYMGFRGREYAPVSGTATYALVDAAQIGHWRLGEGTGSQAGDRSANRNHGTLTASPTWGTGPSAIGGYCLTFASASSQYVTMGDQDEIDTAIDYNTAFCIAGWFKSSTAANQTIVAKGVASTPGWYLRLHSTGYVEFRMVVTNSTNDLDVKTAATTYGGGSWYHVAVVHDGTGTAAGITIYINGVSVSVTTITDTLSSSVANSYALAIAAATGSGSPAGFFNGSLADIRLFNRRLTPLEAAALATDGTFNRPGSHLLISGTLTYLMPMTSAITIRVMARPRFAYDVGSNKPLVQWSIDSTHLARLFYRDTSGQHAFWFDWQDGGTNRVLTAAAETASTINEWRLFEASIDLAGGQTGSWFAINGSVVDSDWGGSPDAFTTQQPILTIDASAYDIAFVEIIPNVAAAASTVGTGFKNVLDERIFWGFNGHAVGYDRCKLRGPSATQGAEGAAVMGYTWRQAIENAIGRQSFAQATMVLNNRAGEFSDDQFATFDPTNEVYNGADTYDGGYLQQRPRVWIESWYSTNFEQQFEGRVSEGKFERTTERGTVSTVEVTALDIIDDIQRRVLRDAVRYVSFDLSKPSDETTSLLHTIARLATQRAVRNYAGNSGFENATPANTYTVGGGGSIARSSSQALIGTYSLELTNDADGSSVSATITFTGDEKLNVGDVITFHLFGRSATTQNAIPTLAEHDSGGSNASTTGSTVSLTGGAGWFPVTVTHEITDPDSDRLVITWATDGNTLVSYWDLCMVVRGYFAPPYFVLNTTDGAAGVMDADDYAEGSYNTLGFDVDDAPVTHPWAHVPEESNPWEELRLLSDAALARVIRITGAGSMEFRSRMAATYSDPAIHHVVKDPPAGSKAASPVRSISSSLDDVQANRIQVKGARFTLANYYAILWEAKATGDWGAVGEALSVSVAFGDFFPDASDFPEYWADYQEKTLRRFR